MHQGNTVESSPARAILADQDARQASSNKAVRAKVQEAADRRQAERDKDPRYAAWRNQMMLAGGQATGGPRGTKAAANAIAMLPADQQSQALQYIAAGGRGATPLDVQQAGAVQGVRLLQGQNLGAQGATDLAAQQLQNAQRQQAAAYADQEWNKLPYFEKTEARRAQLMQDVENRFGAGMGQVAGALPVHLPPRTPLGGDTDPAGI